MRRDPAFVDGVCARALASAFLLVLAGCETIGTTEQAAPSQFPATSPIIPDVAIRLSPSNTLALEQLAFGAAAVVLLNYIYDPLAPNWTIAEARLNDDTYRLSLKMKRFHRGGDGEAMMVMKRRAAQLKYENGYADYQILDFVEGIESSTPVAQRFGEGVIRLVKASPQR